jgi:hypothetical protein
MPFVWKEEAFYAATESKASEYCEFFWKFEIFLITI